MSTQQRPFESAVRDGVVVVTYPGGVVAELQPAAAIKFGQSLARQGIKARENINARKKR